MSLSIAALCLPLGAATSQADSNQPQSSIVLAQAAIPVAPAPKAAVRAQPPTPQAKAQPAPKSKGTAGDATPTASKNAAVNEKVAAAVKRENAYMGKLDGLVAPLSNYKISDADIANIQAAFKALAAGDVDRASELQRAVTDPAGQRLITWERLRRGKGATAKDYMAFLSENPDWPSRELLTRRMEEQLFTEGGDTDTLSTFFKDGNAQSAAGMAVLASMHLAYGEQAQAKELAAKIWREEDLPEKLEKGFLARFGKMLTEADHKWRLDRLLIDDLRYKASREERAALAKRVIPHLSDSEQKIADKRLAVFLHNDKTKLGDVKPGKDADWGVVFHKIQKLRRAGEIDEAAKLMRSAPRDPQQVANLDEWWTERRNLAYLALKENKPKLAYELVRDAGPLGANALNDQTFMAGWLALRYLRDAKAAEKHFTDLIANADGPLSRARGNYWLGRTAEVRGDKKAARASYEKAASFNDTFHGLLALQKLNPGSRALRFDPPAMPSADLAKRFTSHPAMRAAAIADRAKLGRHITRVFLLSGARIENDEAWAAMAAHLARVTDDTQTSVRIGKAAIARGLNLIYYSYPIHALPKYDPLRPPPETAYLLGLARQETEFNTSTVSGAGARGILQVMKITANHVCKDYKIKCNHGRLLNDASYNTMIASAYVADRLDDWKGSYVLGLPSYNAGPGRTRQWVREFGDPREAGIDPVDWIERIPIEETRSYVAKVLSNIQVYRARLGVDSPLRIEDDLYRAAAHKPRRPVTGGNTDTADSTSD
ncbi:lytic transglycosylase domain-containing protein [Hyphomicrobium sp. D-2]|uniref:lytic transglycosylase domain-containing protein n=1 Tax=Hyphomicrobium sp. D-2 TaxID=3041621 RepID=UPI0024588A2C|nr:lytic transglycosylase domain-containing protein [Hyphomicrobium sp. D-2]MDH4982948.1 transglycosylase SLT domain-containing protein [Hyphomicrobium sp. D-2]